MRFRIALGALTVTSSLIAISHGCGGLPPIEDVCGWVEDPNNCYRAFSLDVGARCGTTGSNVPTGTFLNRTMLDTCILTDPVTKRAAGSVVFGSPLDLTQFPLGQPLPAPPDSGMDAGIPAPTISFTIMTAMGAECGVFTYEGQYTFSASIDACPPDAGMAIFGTGGGGGGTGGGGTGGNSALAACTRGGTGGTAAIMGGMFSISQEQDPTLGPTEFVDTTCPSGEAHHFDLVQEQRCAKAQPLLPQAIIESSAGSTTAPGYVRFAIQYPPATTPPNGKSLVGETPVIVKYFDCAIPEAPPPCADGIKDGDETDVDCGGTTCPTRCMMGQICGINTDCTSPLQCIPDNPSTGVNHCNMMAGAGGGGGGGAGGGSAGGGGAGAH